MRSYTFENTHESTRSRTHTRKKSPQERELMYLAYLAVFRFFVFPLTPSCIQHCTHRRQLRGAYAKIRSLGPDALKNGVVACSAGNHAQGVAYSASHLGIQATIVMPSMTPAIKVDAVQVGSVGESKASWGPI